MTAEESVVGSLGVVTVSIAKNRPGEILVNVRGGSEAFAAWADEPLSRHTQVVVVEQLSARSVRVAPFNSTPLPG
jgi:hypothetical protein